MTNLQVPVAHSRTVSWPASLGVVALAATSATCLRLLTAAAGVDVTVRSAGGVHSVNVPAVISATAVSALLGVAALQVALRFFARGRLWWTIGALVVLVGSLAGPLGAETWQAWLTLTALHLLTGGVVVLGLSRVA